MDKPHAPNRTRTPRPAALRPILPSFRPVLPALLAPLALLLLGTGAWLLWPGGTDRTEAVEPATEVLPRGLATAGSGMPAASDRDSTSGISAVAAGDAPGDLPEWFGRLGAALECGSSEAAEAARYAIRQVFDAHRPDVPAVLARIEAERVRREAIPLWIDVHGAPPAADLQTWLADQPPAVRAAACFRLARLGPDGRALLATVLASEDDERVGSEALVWLLRRGGTEGLDAAVTVRSEEAVIRTAMAGLLARPDDRRLADVLRKALDRPLPFRVREAVVDALAATLPPGLRATPGSTDDLFRRAGGADIVTRTLALREAGNFMDQWKKSAPAPEEIERVRTLVRDAVTIAPDPLVRRAAILSRVGLSADIKDLAGQCRALLKLAERDLDPGVRAAVLRRVHRGSAHTTMPFGPDYLVPYVKDDPDPEVRREALRTLPRYHGQGEREAEARRLLVWALDRDPDRDVRLEATALLTEFGFYSARPELLRAGKTDPDPAFRDALYAAVREQIAIYDPELFEELRAADPRRASDATPPADLLGSAVPVLLDGNAVRLVPRSRQMALPEPIAVHEESEAAPGPESGEPSPATSEGWQRVEIPIPSAAGGPTLQGTIEFHGGGEASLLVVVPPDPLLGGAPWPLSPAAIRVAARRAGHAVLSFSWRGRGGSEGFSGRGAGEREDLRAVLAFVRTPSSAAPWPAGCRLNGGIRFLVVGRGADAADGVLPAGVPALLVAPVRGDPPSAHAAHARGSESLSGPGRGDLEAFLR